MDKKIKWLVCSLVFVFSLFIGLKPASAMPLGTILYRTSSNNNAYGYSSKDLLVVNKVGLVTNLYTGHAGIYIGKENGIDYVAEALPSGLVKTPAKYFLNTRAGEKLIGAKIPKNLTEEQREKVISLARNLTDAKMKYDFDFRHQKGSESGQWTCVGFVEKIYESANIINPKDLDALVYDQNEYAIDITPDGFDNTSVYNSKTGDVFSTTKEFSKISRRPRMLVPAPEIIGYDAGLEKGDDRYFFIPHTQFLQPTLEDVPVDIDLSSDFNDETIRGKAPQLALIFKWSLINNPSSTLRQVLAAAKDKIKSLFKSEPALAVSVVDNKKATTTKKATTATKVKTTKKTTTTKAKKATTAKKTTTAKAKVTTTASTKKAATTTAKVAKKIVANKATSSPKVVVSTKKPVVADQKKIEPEADKPTVKPVAPSVVPANNPVVNNYHTTVVNNPPAETKKLILIGEVGTDWLELYNPNEEAIDLSDGAYRLEKSKTAVDPGIMVRFGNESDGLYPGGVEIPASGSYLVVSQDAGAELKARADAIVSNDNFSWGESGYTIYLGVGAISSNTDPDIIDFVGFGPEAKYFEGSAPAGALVPNSILVRKAKADSTVASLMPGGVDELLGHAYDTNQNQSDFILLNLNPVGENNNNDNTGSEDDNSATSTDSVASSTPKIVISRIYATGDDDYIDLYNDSDEDFDLALNNYRLEKAKSAADPMIMMRFGNENDGSYPRGMVIKARSYYRIVRDEASAEIKATAHAIASGNNFTFDGSGYALYLGQDSISSSDDADIIDLVGFGLDAIYYEGSGPAPAIADEGYLTRKANASSTIESLSQGGSEYALGASYDSDNNRSDFLLIGGEPGSSEMVGGYDSPGLAHLWHFNECRGEVIEDSVGKSDFAAKFDWRIGKWGCAFERKFPEDKLQTSFSALSSKGLSIVFNYRSSTNWGRTSFVLSGPDGGASVTFGPLFAESSGLPTMFRSDSIKWPNDGTWHQGAFVINGSDDYWELYLDGKQVYREYFQAIYSKEFTGLEINTGNYLDEVGLWGRALSSEEINGIFASQLELAPVKTRETQIDPVEIHHWSFNERVGMEAADDYSSSSLFIDRTQWVRLGHEGAAISHIYSVNRKMSVDLDQEIKSDDLSIDFWWRNRSYSSESRGNISLLGDNDKRLFGLIFSPYRPGYYISGNYGMISEGLGSTLPHDNSWHHLVLVYDSYEYSLNFYVDGELKYSIPHPWIVDEAIKKIEVYNELREYELDDLSIWQGALKASQVKAIYQNETGGN